MSETIREAFERVQIELNELPAAQKIDTPDGMRAFLARNAEDQDNDTMARAQFARLLIDICGMRNDTDDLTRMSHEELARRVLGLTPILKLLQFEPINDIPRAAGKKTARAMEPGQGGAQRECRDPGGASSEAPETQGGARPAQEDGPQAAAPTGGDPAPPGGLPKASWRADDEARTARWAERAKKKARAEAEAKARKAAKASAPAAAPDPIGGCCACGSQGVGRDDRGLCAQCHERCLGKGTLEYYPRIKGADLAPPADAEPRHVRNGAAAPGGAAPQARPPVRDVQAGQPR
jgi:hypothetical protein